MLWDSESDLFNKYAVTLSYLRQHVKLSNQGTFLNRAIKYIQFKENHNRIAKRPLPQRHQGCTWVPGERRPGVQLFFQGINLTILFAHQKKKGKRNDNQIGNCFVVGCILFPAPKYVHIPDMHRVLLHQQFHEKRWGNGFNIWHAYKKTREIGVHGNMYIYGKHKTKHFNRE